MISQITMIGWCLIHCFLYSRMSLCGPIYFIEHCSRVSVITWIRICPHSRHPIALPNRRAMRCQLWGFFFRKLTMLWWHSTIYYKSIIPWIYCWAERTSPCSVIYSIKVFRKAWWDTVSVSQMTATCRRARVTATLIRRSSARKPTSPNSTWLSELLTGMDICQHPYIFVIRGSDDGLTLKHRETHGCVVSTVATDALVLKHQAISIHNAD